MSKQPELDYESIENAVMETARGRWFLAEYKKRHAAPASVDTRVLLDAIARLEKVITSMNTSRPADNSSGTDKHTTGSPTAQNNSSVAPAPMPTDLKPQNMQYFKRDEDLFEAAPVNNSQPAKPVSEKNETDTADTGRSRFKVFKTANRTEPEDKEPNKPDNQPMATAGTGKSETAPTPKEPPAKSKTAVAPSPEMTATKAEKDRIVVIRKTGNQDLDIPLQELAEGHNETAGEPDTAPPAA